jgi:hypothetical protein
MSVARRSGLEPVASRTMGTPPAGDTSTAGSSSSRAAPRGLDRPVGDESRSGGVGVKSAQRTRGVSPSCGNEARGARVPVLLKPRSGPTSLDTRAITRPAQERSIQKVAFLTGLEIPTKNHRKRLSSAFRAKARRRRAQSRNNGYTEARVAEDCKWYEDRAKAQDTRIARVLECGASVLEFACPECGLMHERTQGCGADLYCVSCRKTTAGEKRCRFLAARDAVIAEARKLGLLLPHRRGGPYGDKFLTLTIPHLAPDTVGTRIQRLQLAWPPFLKLLNAHLRARVIRHVEWFRVIEWTIGKADQLGNPHLHLWLFAPYLDRELLVDLWRQALLRARCPPEACLRPVLDIRAMRHAQSGAQELIKYLTKDITAGGEKLPPELYAQVIAALEGSRQTQASRGFMARAAASPPLCECGSPLPKRVRLKKPDSPPPSAKATP